VGRLALVALAVVAAVAAAVAEQLVRSIRANRGTAALLAAQRVTLQEFKVAFSLEITMALAPGVGFA
jgi:type II secretory pathway pseudopilin PulG